MQRWKHKLEVTRDNFNPHAGLRTYANMMQIVNANELIKFAGSVGGHKMILVIGAKSNWVR